MNIGVLIGVIGALAWLPGIYGIWEAVKRHREGRRKAIQDGDRMVVESALALLEPYEKRVSNLSRELETASATIDDLKTQLDSATRRANTLNDQLVDAQTELGYLRTQVKIMSAQLHPGTA